jgi:polysaccharide biosynthesis/export protein
MKTHSKIIMISFSVILILSSCVSSKKLNYLQYSGIPDNTSQAGSDNRAFITPDDYRVMPYDNLYIRVITPDPQWSVLFNTMPVGQGGSFTEESAGLLGYPVDSKGFIEIPFVGKLEVGNQTLAEIKVNMDSIFKNYLNDAAITVRLVNNYVSVLGEVADPGRYPLTKDRVNIFEVISMAGDLNEFSDRQKIKLIRQSQYGPIVKEFSVLDRNILTSEYFYLMPNDIIYAQPIRRRIFNINSSLSQTLFGTLATILSSITTMFIIYDYSRRQP